MWFLSGATVINVESKAKKTVIYYWREDMWSKHSRSAQSRGYVMAISNYVIVTEFASWRSFVALLARRISMCSLLSYSLYIPLSRSRTRTITLHAAMFCIDDPVKWLLSCCGIHPLDTLALLPWWYLSKSKVRYKSIQFYCIVVHVRMLHVLLRSNIFLSDIPIHFR